MTIPVNGVKVRNEAATKVDIDDLETATYTEPLCLPLSRPQVGRTQRHRAFRKLGKRFPVARSIALGLHLPRH